MRMSFLTNLKRYSVSDSSFSNMKLDGNSTANHSLVIDHEKTMAAKFVTDQDFFSQMWFGYATSVAVVIGSDLNGQTDMLRYDDCIFSSKSYRPCLRSHLGGGIAASRIQSVETLQTLRRWCKFADGRRWGSASRVVL